MKKILSLVLAMMFALSLLSGISLDVSAAKNIIINGVDIGYASGDYFTKNGKACAFHKSGVVGSNCLGYKEVNLYALQCTGFVRYCQYKVWGIHEWDDTTNKYYKKISRISASECTEQKIKNTFYNCSPATHIRTGGHSLAVVSTTLTGITYADANSDGHCTISQTTMSWEEFAKYIERKGGLEFAWTYKNYNPTPVLSIKYHANGGSISGSDITGYRYKVTDSAGINMRKGAGTSYDIITALAKGTAFDVKVSDVKTANGYTWGKTTVGKNTGWVVISDFVSNDETYRNTKYYLSSSLVCKTSASATFVQNMTYGETAKDGLYNATTFGLNRKGYKFLGWSLTQNGETVIDQNRVLKPEELVPELKNGSKSITVYAIWEEGCLNHSFEYAVTTEPTKTTIGVLSGSCTDCSATSMTIELPKLNESDYNTLTMKPTCTEEGSAHYIWKNTEYGKFEFDLTLSETGHSYDDTFDAYCNECGEIREVIMRGDFDADGDVTVADALLALRIAVKLADCTETSLLIGDIDADGIITVSDALAILRVAARMAD